MSVKVVLPASKKKGHDDDSIVLKLIKSVCFTHATSSSRPTSVFAQQRAALGLRGPFLQAETPDVVNQSFVTAVITPAKTGQECGFISSKIRLGRGGGVVVGGVHQRT